MVWEESPIEAPLDPGCRHHWVIEPADGPSSAGACQKCGEARTFANYVERHDWNQGKAAIGTAQAPGFEPSAQESEIEDDTAEAS